MLGHISGVLGAGATTVPGATTTVDEPGTTTVSPRGLAEG
jgi:hypothetical protein